MPENLRDALNHGLLKRFPLTFLPFVNQQLRQWEFLFPNERKAVEELLLYVASLESEQSTRLFRNVVQLEEKMGVRHWNFSTSEQTIENSSELARSPYFQEWRQAVQAVFNESDRYSASSTERNSKSRNRLVLIDIPRPLPVSRENAWRSWQGIGRTVLLDLEDSGSSRDLFESLLAGDGDSTGTDLKGLFPTLPGRPGVSSSDYWVVDAGSSLVSSLLDKKETATDDAFGTLLSYGRLEVCRERFSHEMNSMRKDLDDADKIFDQLRQIDIDPWCPHEVAADPAVREFVRSVYLSGNGAVIFGNSFVEWAASEAFRRARPTLLAAKFGLRSKPKPFTGVAVFEDPDQVNPLPPVDDLPGSAIDAQILALYVWLAANRYPEYQSSTACVCLAESLSEAYVIAPPEFDLGPQTGSVSLVHLGDALRAWMA